MDKRFHFAVSLRKEKKCEILKKKRSPLPLIEIQTNPDEITTIPTNLAEILDYFTKTFLSKEETLANLIGLRTLLNENPLELIKSLSSHPNQREILTSILFLEDESHFSLPFLINLTYEDTLDLDFSPYLL